MLPLDMVLGGLMRRYKERVPDVGVILGSLRDHGLSEVENDHIAFRSLGSEASRRSLSIMVIRSGTPTTLKQRS